MKALVTLGVLILTLMAVVPGLLEKLPPEWNPFAPFSVTDAPTWITHYKLKRIESDPAACLATLQRAETQGLIRFTALPPTTGQCPLSHPVRVQNFGDVRLSASFLSSCALALRSTMFVAQAAKPLAAAEVGSPLVRIDHLGSYACRNIYHRAKGRLSEHATADALDVSGFQFANGQRISVLKNWPQNETSAHYLRQVFQASCRYYGNSIGPEYNAAHANHFHLGMRGFGVCR